MQNITFFKRHKIIKQFLLFLLMGAISISFSELIHGYISGNVLGLYKQNYENYKALNNPQEYINEVTFVIDTVFLTQYSNSQRGYGDRDIINISGTLPNSKIKHELHMDFDSKKDRFLLYSDSDIASHNEVFDNKIKIKKITHIRVLKSKINNNIFLKDDRYIRDTKVNVVVPFYIVFSIIPLSLILLILKIKSK